MIGVSGIRGVIGTGFSPGMALDFVQAYAAWLKGNPKPETRNPKPKVLLARDTRPSGEMMKHAVLAGLIGSGCEIIDLGIVSTPTLQLAVPRLGADGAICITASHNPVEWNALKFFQPNGMYLDKKQGGEVLKLYESKDFACGSWQEMGTVAPCDEAVQWHLDRILEFVDVEAIRARHFNVVLDCCCGAGTTISPLLLDALGCSVAKINCDLSGIFPHNPEPLNENLTQLCDAVKEHGADIGFAHDADADRVAVVTDAGTPIGEDYSLVWATAHTFRNKKRGPVVTNLSTTMAIEAVAREFDCETFRAPVGDVNVSTMMKEKGAVIGGEGNGGVIMPDMQFGRDGIAALAYLLEFVALSGKTASELNATIPRFHNIKKTVDFPRERIPQLLQWLKSKEKTARTDERDGLKLEWPKDGFTTSWAHIRGSGTEPIVRVICEAQTREEVERLDRKMREEIEVFEQSW
jgi:phosphomannomutase